MSEECFNISYDEHDIQTRNIVTSEKDEVQRILTELSYDYTDGLIYDNCKSLIYIPLYDIIILTKQQEICYTTYIEHNHAVIIYEGDATTLGRKLLSRTYE